MPQALAWNIGTTSSTQDEALIFKTSGGAFHQRMQHRRAVRIEHAFRIAGGPGGVAERGCGPLIEIRPDIGIALCSNHLLVAKQVRQVHDRHMRMIGHGNIDRDAFQRRCQLLDQRGEADIEKQELIFGVVDDVLDLFGKQPRVHGVQH
jgi:hypothetical protein